jgi:hypothetical protein
VDFGRMLCTTALEAADNGARLSIDLFGGGYTGPYPAALQGDPTAIVVRDAITSYLHYHKAAVAKHDDKRLVSPVPPATAPKQAPRRSTYSRAICRGTRFGRL